MFHTARHIWECLKKKVFYYWPLCYLWIIPTGQPLIGSEWQKWVITGTNIWIFWRSNKRKKQPLWRQISIMCQQVLSALGYHVLVPDYRGRWKLRFMTISMLLWLFIDCNTPTSDIDLKSFAGIICRVMHLCLMSCLLLSLQKTVVQFKVRLVQVSLWVAAPWWPWRASLGIWWWAEVDERNFTGFGDSTGEPTEAGVTTDALYVYNWVKERSEDSLVVIWGHSLGTGSVTKHSLPSAFVSSRDT